MTWTADPKKREAINEHGYKITWASNKYGTWFNALSPNGAHIDAGYDKEIVKARCDAHWGELQRAKAMRAAYRAAVEVA